jgi:hypothetical protein
LQVEVMQLVVPILRVMEVEVEVRCLLVGVLLLNLPRNLPQMTLHYLLMTMRHYLRMTMPHLLQLLLPHLLPPLLLRPPPLLLRHQMLPLPQRPLPL